MNKNQSKYFNTAIKMNEALITLLEKKDFAYITIKEICEVAGVNRSTFYLHYENTSDLLDETTRYIMDKHLAYYAVDTKSIASRIESSTQAELIFITSEYLTPYLTFIRENQRLFRVAIHRFNTMNMQQVYEQLFRRVFDPVLARFRVPAHTRTYVIRFYLTGIFAIVMEWLDHDCADSIETISGIITDCVLYGRSVHDE